jgi:hypothetical protein
VIHRCAMVLILSHMWQGRVHLLLGIHHTLVWNHVFVTPSGVVAAHTIVGPAGGQVVLGDGVYSQILSSI